MPATVEKLDHNMVKVTVDVDANTFREALQDAFRKNRQYFQIPGFRKGKAPYAMVKNYYGEGVLYNDAIEALMDPTLDKALEELNLKNQSRPSVDVVDASSEKGATLTYEFAVWPDVTFGEAKGIEGYRPSDTVEDEAVDKEIEKDREKASRLVTVDDRPVAEGDTVTLDYRGLKDGVAFDGGTSQGHQLVIGSKTFIPGFEEALIGHEKGEEFNIDLTFPEDYGHKDLAGADVMFEIVIKDIAVKELPALDDEFAKDMSDEADTFEEYRQAIRSRLEDEAKKRADQRFKNEVVAKFVADAEVDIPPVMIDERVDDQLREQAGQLQQMGLSFDQYLQYTGMTVPQFRQQLRPGAAQQVRSRIVLQSFADHEGIEVSDEEVDDMLKEIAEARGEDFEKLKEAVPEVIREDLVADKKVTKVIDLLMESAVATDVEPEHHHHHGHDHDHDHDHDHHHDHDHDHEHEEQEEETDTSADAEA